MPTSKSTILTIIAQDGLCDKESAPSVSSISRVGWLPYMTSLNFRPIINDYAKIIYTMINDQLQYQVLRGNGHITEGDHGDLLGQDRPSHSIDGILGNFSITVILTVTALMAYWAILSSWSSSHAMRTISRFCVTYLDRRCHPALCFQRWLCEYCHNVKFAHIFEIWG